MPDTFEKPEVTMLSAEEIKQLVDPPKVPLVESEHAASIEYYKSKIRECADGEGFFVPAEYRDRVKLRRRITKAAALAGCTVVFKKNNRGGEVVKVHRAPTIE